jgi:hypothetical protein
VFCLCFVFCVLRFGLLNYCNYLPRTPHALETEAEWKVPASGPGGGGGGVAGAGEGQAGVEKYVEEHQDMEMVSVAGTRSWVVCAKTPR